MDAPEERLKFLLIGESDVGKASLLLRYTGNEFSKFMTTIGVDVKTKVITVDGRPVKLQIWDTAGQEKFRSITKAYYRGAHGILVVFDVSRRNTFNQTRVWINSIREYTADSNPIDVILVGNKCDLERSVSREEAEALAAQFQLSYFETSAEEATNVNAAFQTLAQMALKRRLSMGGKSGNAPAEGVDIAPRGMGGGCKC